MGMFLKEPTYKTRKTAMVFTLKLMEVSTEDSSSKEREMVKASISSRMVINTKGSGKMESDKAKVSLHGVKDRFMKENG